MVHLGSLNSRMKDFYDVWRLSQQFEFDPEVLAEAIRQTLQHRKTKLIPFDQLKADLIENDMLEKQWSAFLAKSSVSAPQTFHVVLDQIGAFLDPLFERIDHLQ